LRYLPLTEEERKRIYDQCEINSFDELVDNIPKELRIDSLKIPTEASETELLNIFKEKASRTRASDFDCYLGQGVYDHEWPRVIDYLISRGEFLTAYTPYQAELSQGTLQSLFEFQSMIAELMGMEVSNASLYDYSTACVEACLMAARIKKKSSGVFLITEGFYERTQKILRSYLEPIGFEVKVWEADAESWSSTEKSYDQNSEVIAVLAQSPNRWGKIEGWTEARSLAEKNSALKIACIPNMHSLSLFQSPGEEDFDIAVGEGQGLGIPMGYGGPYLGLLCTKKKYIRQIPGRLVGATESIHGEAAYCITLATREQHIRREKATSNICSNQNLMALRAAMYLSILSQSGLEKIASSQYSNAVFMAEEISKKLKLPSQSTDGKHFNEIAFAVNEKQLAKLQLMEKKLHEKKILPWLFDKAPNQSKETQSIVLSFTEKYTPEKLNYFLESIEASL